MKLGILLIAIATVDVILSAMSMNFFIPRLAVDFVLVLWGISRIRKARKINKGR